MNFDIQNNKPLSETIYGELRNLILTGKIMPGTRIKEIEIASNFSVSRTPVREAIMKLEKEGLVIFKPRKGAYASELPMKDMIDILEVKENLEGLAAYLAAERMTKEDMKALGEIKGNFEEASEKENMADMASNDIEFHSLIAKSSRNTRLIDMIEQLQEMVLRFGGRYTFLKDFNHAKGMIAEHECIFEEIISGNKENARLETLNHIGKGKEMIINDKRFK